MTDFRLIDNSNFLSVAVDYFIPSCTSREVFTSSLNIIYSAKGDITKYLNNPDDYLLRMVVNKLITISNEFGVEGCQRLLFFRCTDNPDHLITLKSIWVALDLLDEPLPISNELTIDYTIDININIFTRLCELIGIDKRN